MLTVGPVDQQLSSFLLVKNTNRKEVEGILISLDPPL